MVSLVVSGCEPLDDFAILKKERSIDPLFEYQYSFHFLLKLIHLLYENTLPRCLVYVVKVA